MITVNIKIDRLIEKCSFKSDDGKRLSKKEISDMKKKTEKVFLGVLNNWDLIK